MLQLSPLAKTNMKEEMNYITINKSYTEKLHEIKGEVYKKLVNGKISNYFNSLGELLVADPVAMIEDNSIYGFGKSKGVLLENFQKELEIKNEYYSRIHSILQPFQILVEEGSFAEQIKSILTRMHSYWKAKEWLSIEMGYSENKISCSEVLDLYYGINENGVCTENSVIAKKFNCDIFNVDLVRLKKINLLNIFKDLDELVKIVKKKKNFYQ